MSDKDSLNFNYQPTFCVHSGRKRLHDIVYLALSVEVGVNLACCLGWLQPLHSCAGGGSLILNFYLYLCTSGREKSEIIVCATTLSYTSHTHFLAQVLGSVMQRVEPKAPSGDRTSNWSVSPLSAFTTEPTLRSRTSSTWKNVFIFSTVK